MPDDTRAERPDDYWDRVNRLVDRATQDAPPDNVTRLPNANRARPDDYWDRVNRLVDRATQDAPPDNVTRLPDLDRERALLLAGLLRTEHSFETEDLISKIVSLRQDLVWLKEETATIRRVIALSFMALDRAREEECVVTHIHSRVDVGRTPQDTDPAVAERALNRAKPVEKSKIVCG